MSFLPSSYSLIYLDTGTCKYQQKWLIAGQNLGSLAALGKKDSNWVSQGTHPHSQVSEKIFDKSFFTSFRRSFLRASEMAQWDKCLL